MQSHNLSLAKGNIDGNKKLLPSDGHGRSWMVMDGLECHGWDCHGYESELHQPLHCYLHSKRNEFSGAVYTEVTVNSHNLFFYRGIDQRNDTKWIVTQAEESCKDTYVVKDAR
jgi:hypothetical protein